MAKYQIGLRRSKRSNPHVVFTVKAPNSTAALRKVAKMLRPNVAAGFYDEDGIFHPIRTSYDYSRSRAGEGRKRKRKARRRGRRR